MFGPCANVSGLQNLCGEGGNAASGPSPLCGRQSNKMKQKKPTLTKVPRKTSGHQAQSCRPSQQMVLATPCSRPPFCPFMQLMWSRVYMPPHIPGSGEGVAPAI